MKILSKILLTSAFLSVFSACKTEKNYITNTTGPADWQPPAVSWQSVPDAEVRGTVGLDVTVRDSSTVAQVKLYVDGRDAQTLTTPPYRFSIVTDSLPDGVHLCEARAWDRYDNLGISPVLRVNVVNSVAQGPRLIWVPDNFALIQAAINASQDFDTIRVRDGIYYETLNTFGKGIWIESEHGPTECTISGIASWNTILISSSVSVATIRGFKLTGSQVVVRYDDGAQAILANNVVISDTAWSLLYAGSSGGNIVNNLFAGTQSEYAAIQLAYFWGAFENNIVMNTATWALYDVAMNVNPVFHGYNCFWNNGENYGRFTPGVREFEANPLLDSLTYNLLLGSPCIDAGDSTIFDLDETRSDIGPSGGPMGYR
jgi:hypothetical protein